MNRRDFLRASATAAATALLPLTSFGLSSPMPSSQTLPAPSARRLPRWRGFNLLEKFIASVGNHPFRETDFAWIAEFGFDFARLPMSYHCWSSPRDWKKMDERVLREIDQAIAYGEKYGVHVCLNFHRAPGYSVDTSTAEPFNLWKDAEALDACCHHWATFARRYQGIPNTLLSFDLVNEPAFLTSEPFVFLDDVTYARVVRALVSAIRSHDASRLIVADGLLWGALPAAGLGDLGLAQSRHSYFPHPVSHWKASWVPGSDQWPEPTWPYSPTPEVAAEHVRTLRTLQQALPSNVIARETLHPTDTDGPWDRAFLRRQFDLWSSVEAEGQGVHVGEFGCYNQTPHAVALAFLEDNLALCQEKGWGWALWNFRGDFGVLDSGRADVSYEEFRGSRLDRALLSLLQRY